MKRILALMLCLLMAVSLCTTLASATNPSSFQETCEDAFVELMVDDLIREMSDAVTVDANSKLIEMDRTQLEFICEKLDLDALNAYYCRKGLNPVTVDALVNNFVMGIEDCNCKLRAGEYTILPGGTIVETDNEAYYLQGGSTFSQTFWWGVRHYKSTVAANRWIYELNQAGHLNTGAAAIGGAVFGGVGAIPNGLTAVYLYMVANSASYYNSLSNRGIVADITWILVYKMRTQ